MIIKKILKLSTLSLFYLLSPILFLLIKLFKPLKIIRIIPLLSNRYGHLVINPEFYLIEKLNIPENLTYYLNQVHYCVPIPKDAKIHD